MPTKCLINAGEYRDSVTLMEVARDLTQLPGVVDAAVMMATEANKMVMREAGLFLPEIASARPNDLVIVVQGETEDVAASALQRAVHDLARQTKTAGVRSIFQPRTIYGAVRRDPDVNLAIISVAGQYAAAEAWEALHNGLHVGLHVLLFSDNVPLDDEIALKQYAAEHGLLMMGPDCGTAIINGTALGFANAVPRGPVGIVAAAGTSLQEVSSLPANMGVGIRQGIGTGARDLQEQVGGVMMLAGIAALQSDPKTEVLLLTSKPPAPTVVERVLRQVPESEKPTVICFLGGDPDPVTAGGAISAHTLQEAAYLATSETKDYRGPTAGALVEQERVDLEAQALELRKRLKPGQRYLRGFFSGGTLAAEALVIWDKIPGQVLSNVSVDARLRLKDAARSAAHFAVDLGDDEFTIVNREAKRQKLQEGTPKWTRSRTIADSSRMNDGRNASTWSGLAT